ncbi:hypothetical protein ACWGR4_32720 [Embleya sp. NPDC055664]
MIALATCVSLTAVGVFLGHSDRLPWQEKTYSAPEKFCFDAMSGAEVARFISGSSMGKHGRIGRVISVTPVDRDHIGTTNCYLSVPVARGRVQPQGTRLNTSRDDDRAEFAFRLFIADWAVEGQIAEDFPTGATPLGGGISGAVTDNEAWLRVPACSAGPEETRKTARFANIGVRRSQDASLKNIRPILASMLARLTNRGLEAMGCPDRIPELDISAGPVRREPLPQDGRCLPVDATALGITDTTRWSAEKFETARTDVSWCDVFNEKGERALRFTSMNAAFAWQYPQNAERRRTIAWGCEPGVIPAENAALVHALERFDERLRPLRELKAAIVAAAPESACAGGGATSAK